MTLADRSGGNLNKRNNINNRKSVRLLPNQSSLYYRKKKMEGKTYQPFSVLA